MCSTYYGDLMKINQKLLTYTALFSFIIAQSYASDDDTTEAAAAPKVPAVITQDRLNELTEKLHNSEYRAITLAAQLAESEQRVEELEESRKTSEREAMKIFTQKDEQIALLKKQLAASEKTVSELEGSLGKAAHQAWKHLGAQNKLNGLFEQLESLTKQMRQANTDSEV